MQHCVCFCGETGNVGVGKQQLIKLQHVHILCAAWVKALEQKCGPFQELRKGIIMIIILLYYVISSIINISTIVSL